MADNSYELFCPPFLNRPRTCPTNTNAYQPEMLTTNQQSKTDNAKMKMARQNQKYLGAHPEIKAIVSLILRNLFIHRPVKIHEFVGELVLRQEFPGEVAQFLVEHLNFQLIPDEEDEEGEPKTTESPEIVTVEENDHPDICTKMSGHGDHKFLKKMLYGADSQSIRFSVQSSVISYEHLLKMMKSSVTNAARSVEETTVLSARAALLEEDEEEDEENESQESSEDSDDNEEALLEGQRLIFAMVGRTLSPSPSGSDISVLNQSSQGKRLASARHAEFAYSEGGTTQAAAHPRASLYSDADNGDPIDLTDTEEDEEYFEKN